MSEEEHDENTQYTMKYQERESSGFCYYVVCSEQGIYDSGPIIYTRKTEDEDVSKMFFDSLENEIINIYNSIKYKKTLKGALNGACTRTMRKYYSIQQKRVIFVTER